MSALVVNRLFSNFGPDQSAEVRRRTIRHAGHRRKARRRAGLRHFQIRSPTRSFGATSRSSSSSPAVRSDTSPSWPERWHRLRSYGFRFSKRTCTTSKVSESSLATCSGAN